MVKVTALFSDGATFEHEYPDSFMAEAQALNRKGYTGREIVAALIKNDWADWPMFVDIIQNEGKPGAESLRLWT